MDELCTKGATELAALIRSREVRAIDVVDAHLGRIDEVNGALNAVTVTLADGARTAASAIDRRVAAGDAVGPLAGVPFTVKENIDVAGSATTWGCAAFAGQVASTDAPMVARLREAGAIPLARTNLPDFAFRWHTESGLSGHTRNPWDPARTPGGSSGGEAVALATGMTPLGLGNDLGGSLRIPSQMCGTAALRPTMGRVADAAVTEPSTPVPSIQLFNCQGPLARRVRDLRAALDIIAAPDARATRAGCLHRNAGPHAPDPCRSRSCATRWAAASTRTYATGSSAPPGGWPRAATSSSMSNRRSSKRRAACGSTCSGRTSPTSGR